MMVRENDQSLDGLKEEQSIQTTLTKTTDKAKARKPKRIEAKRSRQT